MSWARKHRILFIALPRVGTQLVSNWLSSPQCTMQQMKDRLELIFLPPYSPDLNPVENVWRITKKKATHNRYFETKEDLKKVLFKRFNRYQGNPASLKNVVKKHV
jgi:transposase